MKLKLISTAVLAASFAMSGCNSSSSSSSRSYQDDAKEADRIMRETCGESGELCAPTSPSTPEGADNGEGTDKGDSSNPVTLTGYEGFLSIDIGAELNKKGDLEADLSNFADVDKLAYFMTWHLSQNYTIENNIWNSNAKEQPVIAPFKQMIPVHQGLALQFGYPVKSKDSVNTTYYPTPEIRGSFFDDSGNEVELTVGLGISTGVTVASYYDKNNDKYWCERGVYDVSGPIGKENSFTLTRSEKSSVLNVDVCADDDLAGYPAVVTEVYASSAAFNFSLAEASFVDKDSKTTTLEVTFDENGFPVTTTYLLGGKHRGYNDWFYVSGKSASELKSEAVVIEHEWVPIIRDRADLYYDEEGNQIGNMSDNPMSEGILNAHRDKINNGFVEKMTYNGKTLFNLYSSNLNIYMGVDSGEALPVFNPNTDKLRHISILFEDSVETGDNSLVDLAEATNALAAAYSVNLAFGYYTKGLEEVSINDFGGFDVDIGAYNDAVADYKNKLITNEFDYTQINMGEHKGIAYSDQPWAMTSSRNAFEVHLNPADNGILTPSFNVAVSQDRRLNSEDGDIKLKGNPYNGSMGFKVGTTGIRGLIGQATANKALLDMGLLTPDLVQFDPIWF